MLRLRTILVSLLLCANYAQAQDINSLLNEFFTSYHLSGYQPSALYRMDSARVDDENKEIRVYANEAFCAQPFTPASVRNIYSRLQRKLYQPYNTYNIFIFNTKGENIEQLIPNLYREEKIDDSRSWGSINYKGYPWTKNVSAPYTVSAGLQGRHLMVWPSHGRYYKNDRWQWQRPYIYCTTEDIFTQSFVFPFLFPMLEKAGAVVYSPRERDVQFRETIVDNDNRNSGGTYTETYVANAKWQTVADSIGFARPEGLINDSIFPFRLGTARQIAAVQGHTTLSTATWSPRIPRKGNYAVYVSYASLPNSVPDAHYTVYHKGGRTQINVNQQMGGSTWVYLGTFPFDEGENHSGRVVLSNQSSYRGVVTADGVRFGGGFAQDERGTAFTSGLPRFLEAARYQAQWAGLPDSLFNTEAGFDDYKDDLRCRPNLLNYFAGGSDYLPAQSGKRIPFELSLAIHSDAGYRKDGSIFGTLGICTTQDGSGLTTFPSGLSRKASADFADILLTGIVRDLGKTYNVAWTRRELWDRNYAETRMPNVPSAILETMSHQNFSDMKFGHDPNFKFTMARAIYKAILRYVSASHKIDQPVVAPLPIRNFSALLSPEGDAALLNWQATPDSLEPSAVPDKYVLYIKQGDNEFDNGQIVNSTSVRLNITPGVRYSFQVTAVNSGGESFPSEALTLYKAKESKHTVLIVNGFTRLSGPCPIETPDSLGFDLRQDIGVPYLYTTAFAGYQKNFDRAAEGLEGPSGLGYCGQELMGKQIAGNTFNYPETHGAAIQAMGDVSFVSCSKAAAPTIDWKHFDAVDYIAGLEKNTSYNLRPYEAFPTNIRHKMEEYARNGGNLLVSGAYVASDEQTSAAKNFLSKVFKAKLIGSKTIENTDSLIGLNLTLPFYNQLNEDHYTIQNCDLILPTDDSAFTAFTFSDRTPCGVAFRGKQRRAIMMTVPFECITSATIRQQAMKAMLRFLFERK